MFECQRLEWINEGKHRHEILFEVSKGVVAGVNGFEKFEGVAGIQGFGYCIIPGTLTIH